MCVTLSMNNSLEDEGSYCISPIQVSVWTAWTKPFSHIKAIFRLQGALRWIYSGAIHTTHFVFFFLR